jgi:hypothetical protein
MKSQDIEQYLAELGAELESRGIEKPVRILMIGGAYMMLFANAPRTTDDVDIFWVEEGEEFQKARIALRDAVQTIASKHTLPSNWFNYLTQMLIYDKIIVPQGELWKRYGPLHIYTPPKEYILALKILAGRAQDISDCRILLSQTDIKTRQEAQKVLDRYILSDAQRDEAVKIENSLNMLFRSESETEE